MEIKQISIDGGFLYMVSSGKIYRKDMKVAGASWEELDLPDLEEIETKKVAEMAKISEAEKNG